LASLASSEVLVLIAWVTGVLALLFATGLTVEVIRLRQQGALDARRRAELVAQWRPLLFEAALGGAPHIRPLDGAEQDAFIALWNEVQDVLAPEPRAALGSVAFAVGAERAARRRLWRGHPVARAQALRMIGHLGIREDYALVRSFLDDPRSYLSLTAARALVGIDPVRAPADLLPRIATRSDWPTSLLVAALEQSNGAALAAELRRACNGATPGRRIRLLAIVELVDDRTAEDVLRRSFLTADPEVVAAVLKHARTPAVADLARAGCAHASWAVRTQAATALGRIGAPADRELLLALLEDRHWWVRYRAAQALVSGRFGERVELLAAVERSEDRFSHDIVAHVLAERAA
jgi:HEAT repeat protein